MPISNVEHFFVNSISGFINYIFNMQNGPETLFYSQSIILFALFWFEILNIFQNAIFIMLDDQYFANADFIIIIIIKLLNIMQ